MENICCFGLENMEVNEDRMMFEEVSIIGFNFYNFLMNKYFFEFFFVFIVLFNWFNYLIYLFFDVVKW